jgi:hypothetical protein
MVSQSDAGGPLCVHIYSSHRLFQCTIYGRRIVRMTTIRLQSAAVYWHDWPNLTVLCLRTGGVPSHGGGSSVNKWTALLAAFRFVPPLDPEPRTPFDKSPKEDIRGIAEADESYQITTNTRNSRLSLQLATIMRFERSRTQRQGSL